MRKRNDDVQVENDIYWERFYNKPTVRTDAQKAAFWTLVAQNDTLLHKSFYYMLKQFPPRRFEDVDDRFQEVLMNFYRREYFERYDSSKGEWDKYVFNCVKAIMSNLYQEEAVQKERYISHDESITSHNPHADAEISSDSFEKHFREGLTERQNSVLSLLKEGLNGQEIANAIGCSKMTISYIRRDLQKRVVAFQKSVDAKCYAGA